MALLANRQLCGGHAELGDWPWEVQIHITFHRCAYQGEMLVLWHARITSGGPHPPRRRLVGRTPSGSGMLGCFSAPSTSLHTYRPCLRPSYRLREPLVGLCLRHTQSYSQRRLHEQRLPLGVKGCSALSDCKYSLNIK